MIVYWLLFLYFAFGAVMEHPKAPLKANAGPLFWIGGVLITLVIGLRYKVGADWVPYEIMFQEASRAGFTRAVTGGDPGYMLLNWLAGRLGADVWLVNLFCGAIFTFGLLRFAQVQERPWLSVLIAIPYLVVVVAMLCDATSYLPDDILTKVDRASMAVALETRVPYLDHRVAEFAARIPLDLKISGGRGKQILRALLYGLVPRELVERPKAGFAVPVGEWVKGPLRDWAEHLLDLSTIREAGYLDPTIIKRRWSDHLSGRRESTAAIWSILMFQAWLREARPDRVETEERLVFAR